MPIAVSAMVKRRPVTTCSKVRKVRVLLRSFNGKT